MNFDGQARGFAVGNRIVHFALGVRLLAALIAGGGCASPQQQLHQVTVEESAMDGQLLELVEAERRFARMAGERGMRAAFLAHLADSSTVFLPRPVAGRPTYEAMEATDALLSWWPAYAELSAGGDLGFTTGPWEFRGERDSSAPDRVGQYLSFWGRDEDSRWQVLVDFGVSHEPMASPVPSFCRGRRATVRPTPSVPDPQMTVRDAEARLRRLAAQRGYAAAVLQVASPDIRILRQSRVPGLGLDDARTMLQGERDSVLVDSEATLSSRSRDLAAVFGEQRMLGGAEAPQSFGFLRAWRREGDGWRLIVDAALALPDRPGR